MEKSLYNYRESSVLKSKVNFALHLIKWLGIIGCLGLLSLLGTQVSAQNEVSFSHGENLEVAYGDTLSVPLIANNFQDLQTIQFNLHFNPHVFSFVELYDLDTTSGIKEESIGFSETDEGRIFFIGLSEIGDALGMADGDTLCRIRFHATGVPGSTSLFGVQGFPLELQAFDGADFISFLPSSITLAVTPPTQINRKYSICPDRDSTSLSELKVYFFGDTSSFIYTLINLSGQDTVYSNTLFPDTNLIVEDLSDGNYLSLISRDSILLFNDTIPLENKSTVDPTIITTDASCPQIPDGQIEIPLIEGGAPPYVLEWPDSSLHFRTYSNLLPDTFQLTIYDQEFCQYPFDIEVGSPTAVVIETITNATCEDSEDGGVAVDVVNLPRFEDSTLLFSLTGNDWIQQVRFNVLGIQAGNFTYYIQDTAGCIYTQEVFIPFENAINIENIITIDPRCFGTTDGLVSATARLDVIEPGDFVFDWSGPNPSVSDSLFLAVGLPSDSFLLSVSHTGLPQSCNDTRQFILQQPDSLTIEANASNETCVGLGDGSASVAVTGGNAPFSFEWEDGSMAQERNGLMPGNYGVTVTDDNFCSASTQIDIGEGLDITFSELNLRNVSCFGLADGSAFFSIDTTTITNQPSLSYTLPPAVTDTLNLESLSSSISDLDSGSFTLSIISSNGCVADTTFSISQPDDIFIDTLSLQNSDCNRNTGVIAIDPMGGNGGPYDITWSNNQTGQRIDSIGNGAFEAIISDSASCTKEFEFNLLPPPEPQFDTILTTPAICPGDSTAGAEILLNSADTIQVIWSNGLEGTLIENVTAGLYQAVLINERNCTDTLEVLIQQPDSFAFAFETTAASEDANDGSATVFVQGGTPPYEYIWNTTPIQTDSTANNLGAGLYQVLIIDSQNCRASDTVRIEKTTGIATLNSRFSVKVWPNPSSGRIMISSKDTERANPPKKLLIYNNQGRTIHSQSWPVGTDIIESHLSGSGLYYIHVLYQTGEFAIVPVTIQQ